MQNTSTLAFFTHFSIFSRTLPPLVRVFFLNQDASLTMSSSCKMHESLWIDTGPLISLHRQVLCSGTEPTPVAATAVTQIRGQRGGGGGGWPTLGVTAPDEDLNCGSSKQLSSRMFPFCCLQLDSKNTNTVCRLWVSGKSNPSLLFINKVIVSVYDIKFGEFLNSI